MTGRAPFIPGLLGLPRDYLNAQLGAWRRASAQARAPDCMAQVAVAPDAEDIAARLGLARGAARAGARAAAGADRQRRWPLALRQHRTAIRSARVRRRHAATGR